MKKLRSYALIMACASFFAAGCGAFLIWLTLGLPAQSRPPTQSSRLSAIVESAPSCEAMKLTCTRWAAIEDRRADHVALLNDLNEKLFRTVLFGMIGWGLVTAMGFFYLYLLSRKTNASVAQ